MKTRVLTAVVALPIIIAAIVLPMWWRDAVWLFVAIAAFSLFAGLFEFYSLTRKLELKADAAVGFLWAAALFVGFIFDSPARQPELILATLAAFVVSLLVSQAFRFKADFSKMLTGVCVTIFGVIYVAFL